jgi:hypothetical protein
MYFLAGMPSTLISADLSKLAKIELKTGRFGT